MFERAGYEADVMMPLTAPVFASINLASGFSRALALARAQTRPDRAGPPCRIALGRGRGRRGGGLKRISHRVDVPVLTASPRQPVAQGVDGRCRCFGDCALWRILTWQPCLAARKSLRFNLKNSREIPQGGIPDAC